MKPIWLSQPIPDFVGTSDAGAVLNKIIEEGFSNSASLVARASQIGIRMADNRCLVKRLSLHSLTLRRLLRQRKLAP